MTQQTRPYTETELIPLLKQNDPVASSILYEKYGAPIYGLICQVLPNTKLANESFVDTFLMIMRSLHQYDPSKSRFFTWMMQIARQTALKKLKSLSKRTYAGAGGISPAHRIMAGQTYGEEAKNHDVLNLAFLKGYSIDEVAGQLGIPARLVKEKMNSALLTINSQDEK